ncbi:excalibur calcium-binding domain-containing protein [Oceanobacillus profundus]|uniref:Excalibur calcium-binding domain-containing protein n=1 Tax=Oceanobacillus profundus TaxID=372463 RepID=A0A417YJT8_9BACI|nr:excalibur calcium-binding domain-containing protein [Oceanobacillus profundus]RHW33557.1 hypothetical protein D1B32_05815 [Oceanobacillus profundus]
MIAISILGVFAIISALIYLVFHFIKKLKDKERVLSKKIFYPFLIGGFVLIIIGSAEIGTQARLNEALEDVEVLTTENKSLESEKDELETALLELETEHEEDVSGLEDEVKKLSSENDDYKKQIASLESQDAEIEELEKKVSELTAENKELDSEVSSLESQLASAKAAPPTSTASASTGGSSGSSGSSSSSGSTTASTDVYYKNCTEARNAGAAPVYKGDPGYASHLDRDGDGVGCE